MEKLINEIREWVNLKNEEAGILLEEANLALKSKQGIITTSQIYKAHDAVQSQKVKLNKALAILL